MKTLIVGSVVALTLLLVLSGCGKDEHVYDFTENGCATGEHKFDSKDGYCAGLKDHALNNGCAYTTRKQTFQQNCSGGWTG